MQVYFADRFVLLLLLSEKLDEVELLFLNMHNLINAFRPHQARETVIQMLQTQVQERREAARDIRRTIDESRQAVERVHGELHESADDAAAADGACAAGTENDVKMENADGSGVTGNGGDQANANGAASAAALTPAQQEQAEVRQHFQQVCCVPSTNALMFSCFVIYRKLARHGKCRNSFSRR